MKGAESIVTQIDARTVQKHRPKKGYRVSELDHKFTVHRTRSEAKILKLLYDAGVTVPKLFGIDEDLQTLTLEYIDGPQVKHILTFENMKELGEKIGSLIAQIHNAKVIHADLTTSNMIYFGKKVFLLDFGLSYISQKVEDKAVDLHLLHQSLTSYHAPIAADVMNIVLKTYNSHCDDAAKVIERFETVEKRGRNKH